MNFIKKFKGTIIAIGIFAIVLLIGFCYPAPQGIRTEEPIMEPIVESVLENTTSQAETITSVIVQETPQTAETAPEETIIPAITPETVETADYEETAPKEAIVPVITPNTAQPDAEVETHEELIKKSTLSCSLAVRCDTLFDNMDKITPEKTDLIPANGSILPETEFEFSEGESAFDVLARELKRRKIHFEFTKNPMYDSVYIEGIGNLYEFDAGPLSGWIYRVNGKTLSVGCSQYKLKSGDKIEFLYTCNMGKDL